MSLATWPLRLATSTAWFARELLVSNLGVIWDILTPTHLSTPQVVRYETRCHTELEVSMLSMLITLTPGTLVLATTETTEATAPPPGSRAVVLQGGTPRTFTIFVHSMFDDSPRAVTDSVRRMERRMLSAMRPVAGAPPEVTS